MQQCHNEILYAELTMVDQCTTPKCKEDVESVHVCGQHKDEDDYGFVHGRKVSRDVHMYQAQIPPSTAVVLEYSNNPARNI